WLSWRAASTRSASSRLQVLLLTSRPEGFLPASIRLAHLHRFRIPLTNPLLEIAHVREQRRTRRPESEGGILDDRLARAGGAQECPMVFEPRILAGRIPFIGLRTERIGIRRARRVLLAVLPEKLVRSRFGERVGRVAGFAFLGDPRQHQLTAESQDTFAPDE